MHHVHHPPSPSRSEGTGLLAGTTQAPSMDPGPLPTRAQKEGASVLSRTAPCAHSARLLLEQQQSQALIAATTEQQLHIHSEGFLSACQSKQFLKVKEADACS